MAKKVYSIADRNNAALQRGFMEEQTLRGFVLTDAPMWPLLLTARSSIHEQAIRCHPSITSITDVNRRESDISTHRDICLLFGEADANPDPCDHPLSQYRIKSRFWFVERERQVDPRFPSALIEFARFIPFLLLIHMRSFSVFHHPIFQIRIKGSKHGTRYERTYQVQKSPDYSSESSDFSASPDLSRWNVEFPVLDRTHTKPF
jgi:hypothetical protein